MQTRGQDWHARKQSLSCMCFHSMLPLFDLVGTLFAPGEVGSCMEYSVEVLLAALAQRLKNDAALIEPSSTRSRNLAGVAGPGHHGVRNVV